MDDDKASQQVSAHDPAAQPAPESPKKDYSDFMPELKSKKRWPKVILFLLLVVIIAAGSGAYWFKHHEKAKPKPVTQTKSATINKYVPPATTNYSSSNLEVDFNYPKSWTVTDSVNNKLTVISPPTDITTASGQKENGEIVMTIENEPGADLSAFTAGSALAVLSSEDVTYTEPTSVQAAQTYLSFLQYSTTTNPNALDGIYITGNYGYQEGQAIPETDISQVNPLVSVTFLGCADITCSSTTATSISTNMWNQVSFSEPIKDMLESLAIESSD